MRIVVCLKQIIDPGLVRFDIFAGKLESVHRILNPADLSALEEGLKMKEKYEAEVIALSVGTPEVEKELKRALIYGADRAIRVWEDWMAEADTEAISSVIARVVEEVGFDLILCGARSGDTSSEFMGAALAEKLEASLVTRVMRVEITRKGEVNTDKKLERGERETYICELPAVVTVEEKPEVTYVPLLSRTFRKGFKKHVELMTPSFIKPTPLVQLVTTTQSKPRTKVGKKINLSGLSTSEQIKVLKGETGAKKAKLSSSPEEEARKIVEKLEEWMA